MAIAQDTVVAIRLNNSDKKLRIANVNDEKYPMCTYSVDPQQVLSGSVSTFLILPFCGFEFLPLL